MKISKSLFSWICSSKQLPDLQMIDFKHFFDFKNFFYYETCEKFLPGYYLLLRIQQNKFSLIFIWEQN